MAIVILKILHLYPLQSLFAIENSFPLKTTRRSNDADNNVDNADDADT